MTETDTETPAGLALELTGIAKAYGNTIALESADLSCQRGEIHGLLGENGAGKSTLVKVLSGLVQPDAGRIVIGGRHVRLHNPKEALRLGVATAFQELTLVPHMSVAQNLMVGREPRTRVGLVSPRRTSEEAERILAAWHAEEIPADVPVSSLSLADRQRLEVVRTFSREPAIALLDEATAALGAAEVDWLMAQIVTYRQQGGTIVYISHRMGEVRQLCDRCTVLRDGRNVETFRTSEHTDSEVVDMMAGKAVQKIYSVRSPRHAEPRPALAVEHLACPPALRDASFTLHKGEILGVAGLHGHGQKELFMALFGARSSKGTISIDGKPVHLRGPHDAVAAHIGISLVPEERKTEGLMTAQAGLPNLTLPSLSQFSAGGFVRRRKERAAAGSVLRQVNAVPSALDKPVSSLSGGNQQKIAIGKWLLAGAQIMLMYDPTRGVDVETKAEIFSLMQQLADQGRSILFYSTDVEELVNVADRTIVMYRGSTSRELAGEAATLESIVEAMLGHSSAVTA